MRFRTHPKRIWRKREKSSCRRRELEEGAAEEEEDAQEEEEDKEEEGVEEDGCRACLCRQPVFHRNMTGVYILDKLN